MMKTNEQPQLIRETSSPLGRLGEVFPPRIGIFGGSFNPIHKGHIALARQILRKAGLDEVWFMVTPLNPFKRGASDLLDDELRLEMARTALSGEEGLVASDYEFRLPKPSYTWDTLQHLSKDYPNREFVLIIGADNWLKWDKWYHAGDILRSHELVVYPREGCPVDADTLPEGVRLLNTRLYKMSSTDIRRRVKEGRGIARLVPASILELVKKYYR
ncbi:nicotinate (nicotinamide) nucleotide adenylyltransferase [Prevotella sp. KH2C16]|uniref:nicotinate (nicotinamide) nucleotide adenylyltransferase n=1 Tax=Prevotella sp. KH2C16 TaxID=1855325 RepID=UPI0008EA47F2|nr:nicotinate (nicotinamide) nucleotide adenylyltransferase [Prevotella sp. KH2C16]SFG35955.1 nicotinate-nucleotide adenylyltransferase [Prevotella sp. KH2C16]